MKLASIMAIQPIGYSRDENSELPDLEKGRNGRALRVKRVQSFIEFVKGFSKEQAIAEAARCVDCESCICLPGKNGYSL